MLLKFQTGGNVGEKFRNRFIMMEACCRRLLGVLAFPVLVVEVESDGDAAREAPAVVAAAATARNTLMASSRL